jgi:SAM-dependent methyltransferase
MKVNFWRVYRMTLQKTYSRFASFAFPVVIALFVYVILVDFRMHSPVCTSPTIGSKIAIQPSAPPAQVFSTIYDSSVWGKNDSGQGYSGTGSTMNATVVYRAFLQDFMKNHAVKSVVDAGCGDWEFSRLIDWKGIDYKGCDIVPSVIERDKRKYKAPHVSFFVADIVEDDLPAADLLLCKNVLQHLPNRDVSRFLSRLSKYRHVLLTDGIDGRTLTSDNHDIVVGQYRPLDVTAPPFNVQAKKVLVYFDGRDSHQVVHFTNPR